jgi:hypothetical protein
MDDCECSHRWVGQWLSAQRISWKAHCAHEAALSAHTLLCTAGADCPPAACLTCPLASQHPARSRPC